MAKQSGRGIVYTSCWRCSATWSRWPDATPTDTRLFPARGRERAEDHEALCSTRASVSLVTLARLRVSTSRSTIQRSDRVPTCLQSLQDGEPGPLGIYGNLMTRPNVLAIIARARSRGWQVILGGPEPANYADEYLAAGADVIVAGEGERALDQLMATEFDAAHWPTIKGIIYRASSGEIVRTGSARPDPSLDAQPWPDRDRVDIARYLQTWRDFHGMDSLSVITARGCPYRCNWCSHSVYGMTHRRRSPHPWWMKSSGCSAAIIPTSLDCR